MAPIRSLIVMITSNTFLFWGREVLLPPAAGTLVQEGPLQTSRKQPEESVRRGVPGKKWSSSLGPMVTCRVKHKASPGNSGSLQPNWLGN